MAKVEPSPQDLDAYADRRVYPRVPVALPASLDAGGQRHSIQLLDVSAGGAKLNCAAKLPVGMAVTLDCGGLARAATIRWHNGRVMGVKFDEELDERVVSALADRSCALAPLMKTRE